jgi:glycosyltransferase involved in cell wall biosynthesis
MRISVWITSYNQRELLVEAVESVLAQTLPPQQVIIVDDASSDGSQEVIAAYATRYPDWITPLYHERNCGVAQSRNEALQMATGEYVTYCDGDDRFLPTKLEREAAALLANPQAEIAFSDFFFVNASGERTMRWAETKRPPEGEVLCQIVGREFPRRTLFRFELVNYQRWRESGLYDVNLSLYEDWEMRIRLTERCRVAYVAEPGFEFRRGNQGLSNVPAAAHLAATDYIVEKHRPLLEQLPEGERAEVKRHLDTWRAHLLRRASREAILRRVPDYRRVALDYYWQSLAYHRFLDYRLLGRIIWPRSE